MGKANRQTQHPKPVLGTAVQHIMLTELTAQKHGTTGNRGAKKLAPIRQHKSQTAGTGTATESHTQHREPKGLIKKTEGIGHDTCPLTSDFTVKWRHTYDFVAKWHHRPTAENLIPIRLDIENEGQRFKDSFTWNPTDPDSEVISFAKRTVKDLKLPPIFITQISQSIHSQLAEFRSYEGQEMHLKERIVPIKLDIRVNNTVIRDQFLWDISNLESDPEEFARTLCKDLDIEDLEVGPTIAVCIREQLFEVRFTFPRPSITDKNIEEIAILFRYAIAIQGVASARESRVGKKGRRGAESFINSKMSSSSLDLVKLFGSKGSVIRKRKDWYLYEPIVDILSNEEAEALDAREVRNARDLCRGSTNLWISLISIYIDKSGGRN
ncbi:hypothetical protein M5K25_021669 [Dendrobium thyrsiflorum]|uniref:Bushy growth protein n=1 Tax=Dendrobium thyrsiflorum TaxID=117978 RepID=A0ABD0U510_DENTH